MNKHIIALLVAGLGVAVLILSGWAITIDLGIGTLIAAFAVIVGLTVVWWIRHRNKV